MSTANDPLDQRFTTARQLPTPLSLKEVELIFLNPTPLPAAKPWYGGSAKFFTMLFSAILVSLALLTGGTPEEHPKLSGFPIATSIEKPMPTSATTLPSKTGSFLTETNQTPKSERLQTPAVPTLLAAPVLSLAPAAAPKSFGVAEIDHGSKTAPLPAISEQQESSGTFNSSAFEQASGALPPPIFTGDWRLRDQRLQVILAEVSGVTEEQKYYLPISLSTKELAILKQKAVPAYKIERAAGTLILEGGKRRGTFEFLPNESYRQRLNAAGMGDARFSEEEAATIPVGSLTIVPAATLNTEHPRDLIWFKYFVSNVNEDYFQVLYDHGYTKEDLQEFHHLPNYTVNRTLLLDLLETTDKLFAEKVPLKDLASFSWRLTYLNTMLFKGLKALSMAEFRQQEKNHTLGLSALFDGSQDSARENLIGLLHQGQLPLLLDTLTGIFDTLSFPQGKPDDWGLNTPGKAAYVLDLSTFRTLIVTGKMRLFINYSDGPQKITVYATPERKANLKVQQKGRKLSLTNRRAKGDIDIEISGPKLRLITSKSGLKIYYPKKEE